jgi:23S rRNA pseudouridine2605 synthase
MYIAKYLAHCGLCSRRKAVELVKEGQITVNDQKVTDVTYVVQPKDKVKYKNRIIKSQELVYILLNKPKDYVTTLSDEKGRRTVIDLIKDKTVGRIYPVGRLDRMTTGVLLLTNDGELTQKLSHPKYEVQKTYHIVLDKAFDKKDFDRLLKGIKLQDGFIKPDKLYFFPNMPKNNIKIELHSGKNRIVRRLFEYFGYKIKKLDRISYAFLSKKGLARGSWRFLTKSETLGLKSL